MDYSQPPQPEAGENRGIARQSIQDRYLDKALEAIRSFDWIIGNLNGITDTRPRFAARQIINRVLDDEIRCALLTEFDKRLEEIASSNKNNESKAAEVLVLSIDFVGAVNSYFDEFLHIHKHNVIGEV